MDKSANQNLSKAILRTGNRKFLETEETLVYYHNYLSNRSAHTHSSKNVT